MIVYLSGAMENASDEGANWREELTIWLKSELNHDVIDPVKTSQQLVNDHQAHDYRKWKSTDPEQFKTFVRKAIDLDLNNVMNRCDYLICLWNKDVLSGGGTHGEVTMAYSVKKPVYLINQLPLNELSGWIMSCAEKIFSNMDELKDYLINTYTNR